MPRWTIAFLVISLVAAAVGFSSIASAAAELARSLFVVFMVLFVFALLIYAMRGKKPSK